VFYEYWASCLKGSFPPPTHPPGPCPPPPSHSMRTLGSFPRLKQPGHDDYHLPPFSAKGENEWSSTPLYNFVACKDTTLPLQTKGSKQGPQTREPSLMLFFCAASAIYNLYDRNFRIFNNTESKSSPPGSLYRHATHTKFHKNPSRPSVVIYEGDKSNVQTLWHHDTAGLFQPSIFPSGRTAVFGVTILPCTNVGVSVSECKCENVCK
jgi:hypothetical protein